MAEIVQLNVSNAAVESLQDGALEQNLLGMLIWRPELLDTLPPSFQADSYAYPVHADIHRATVACYNASSGSVLGPVCLALGADKELRSYIAACVASASGQTAEAAYTYATHIVDLARRRGMMSIFERAREATIKPMLSMPSEALIGRTVSDLELLVGDADASTTVSFDEALAQAIETIGKANKHGGPVGVLTGMSEVDEMLGGMKPGNLLVLAGRPGMGKSALAMQWALHRAKQAKLEAGQGKPLAGVFIGSLEMTADELAMRALAAEAEIDLQDLINGRTAHRIGELIAAQKRLGGLPLTIDDAFGQTMAVLALKARAAQRKHGLSLIVIDHAHNVRPEKEEAKHGRTVAVGAISLAGKHMAKSLRVPVLLLAQLSRATEARDDKRPGLSDLRDSGDIEQNADAVMFLYRAVYYLGTRPPERKVAQTPEAHANAVSAWERQVRDLAEVAELIITKARQGKPGTATLGFVGATTSFYQPDNRNPDFFPTEIE